MPMGRNLGVDGRGPYDLKDPAKVIAASLRPTVELFIDRDHETFYMPPGTKITAAGWMKKLEARDDGIWAFTEWTDSAAAQIAAKEYRYISPVFAHDPATGEVLSIKHASLTNNPNFELTAVASAVVNNPQKETDTMDEFLKQLAALLGLAETATSEEVIAAITERLGQLSAASANVADIRKALKLDDKADFKAVVSAAAAVVTGADEPDPTKYVPMAAFQELSEKFTADQKKKAEKEAVEAVAAASAARKVSPAMKDWALKLAKSDPEAFAAFAKNAPVVISAAAQAEGDPEKEIELTEEEKAAAKSLGISEDDMKATKKANAE